RHARVRPLGAEPGSRVQEARYPGARRVRRRRSLSGPARGPARHGEFPRGAADCGRRALRALGKAGGVQRGGARLPALAAMNRLYAGETGPATSTAVVLPPQMITPTRSPTAGL